MAVLEQVAEAGAIVPAHWRLEVVNGFQVAVRRGTHRCRLPRRRQLPLATLDGELMRAACAENVPLVGAE